MSASPPQRTLRRVVRIGTKPTWPRLREQIRLALAAAHPTVVFEISAPDAPPVVRWHHGPTERAVAQCVGSPAGWSLVSTLAGPDDDAHAGVVLHLDRSYSVRALAIGVVRYRAAHPRRYDSGDARARRRLWAILDEDDPERSGYPLSDAMADLLLADAGDADTADALAQRLDALGFDALWNRAWATTPL
jgi:hypothetical protein